MSIDAAIVKEYNQCIETSERVCWKISDLLPKAGKLDFSRPFMADSLTLISELPFLDKQNQLVLNHIRSGSYINLFAFVEEYITAEIIAATTKRQFDENARIRALLRFSEEEVKHQTLFLEYLDLFQNNFPKSIKCNFLAGASDVANIILSNSEAGVMFLTLHLELITQQHYVDCFRDKSDLDPQFSNMLKNHWLEEIQHARIDTLELDDYLKGMTPEDISHAFDEYFGILDAFVGLLKNQVDMDIESLRRVTNVSLDAAQVEKFQKIQGYSYVKDFIVYGFENIGFRKYLNKIDPALVARMDEKGKAMRAQFGRPEATVLKAS